MKAGSPRPRPVAGRGPSPPLPRSTSGSSDADSAGSGATDGSGGSDFTGSWPGATEGSPSAGGGALDPLDDGAADRWVGLRVGAGLGVVGRADGVRLAVGRGVAVVRVGRGAGFGAVTTTDPRIPVVAEPCVLQKYVYVPAASKVNVVDRLTSGMELSLVQFSLAEVTVWLTPPVVVHVTVSPTRIVTALGAKVLVPVAETAALAACAAPNPPSIAPPQSTPAARRTAPAVASRPRRGRSLTT